MTFKEFQAWLDGFSESFDKGRPNKEQWEKIQKKMEVVLDADHVYIPYPTYPSYPYNYWYPNNLIQTIDSITVTTSNTDDFDAASGTITTVDGDTYVTYTGMDYHEPEQPGKAIMEKVQETIDMMQ